MNECGFIWYLLAIVRLCISRPPAHSKRDIWNICLSHHTLSRPWNTRRYGPTLWQVYIIMYGTRYVCIHMNSLIFQFPSIFPVWLSPLTHTHTACTSCYTCTHHLCLVCIPQIWITSNYVLRKCFKMPQWMCENMSLCRPDLLTLLQNLRTCIILCLCYVYLLRRFLQCIMNFSQSQLYIALIETCQAVSFKFANEFFLGTSTWSSGLVYYDCINFHHCSRDCNDEIQS